jgi:hypothetical protein
VPLYSNQELLVISVVNLHGTFLPDVNMYSWLLRYPRPFRRIGGSLFVYDITNDRAAHSELYNIYRIAGLDDLAERERTRLGIIDSREYRDIREGGGHGNRTLGLEKTAEESIENVVIPASAETFSAKIVIDDGVLLQKCPSEASKS